MKLVDLGCPFGSTPWILFQAQSRTRSWWKMCPAMGVDPLWESWGQDGQIPSKSSFDDIHGFCLRMTKSKHKNYLHRFTPLRNPLWQSIFDQGTQNHKFSVFEHFGISKIWNSAKYSGVSAPFWADSVSKNHPPVLFSFSFSSSIYIYIYICIWGCPKQGPFGILILSGIPIGIYIYIYICVYA